MIEEYLKERGAVGEGKAISTDELKRVFHLSRRALVDVVTRERAAGSLICSTNSSRGGYYMPSCVEEVRKQRDKLERGIKIRSVVLRPFRRFMKEHEKREKQNE